MGPAARLGAGTDVGCAARDHPTADDRRRSRPRAPCRVSGGRRGTARPQRPEEAAPAPEPAPADVEPAAEPPAGDAATTEQPQAEAAPTAEAATPGYNPQWDPARGTYIVWSAERGHWLGWDDAAKEWKPL